MLLRPFGGKRSCWGDIHNTLDSPSSTAGHEWAMLQLSNSTFLTLPFLPYLSYSTFLTLSFLLYLSYSTFLTLPFLVAYFYNLHQARVDIYSATCSIVYSCPFHHMTPYTNVIVPDGEACALIQKGTKSILELVSLPANFPRKCEHQSFVLASNLAISLVLASREIYYHQEYFACFCLKTANYASLCS